MSDVASAAESIRVTLPDGTVKEVPRGTTVRDLAFAIGPGLGKATVGAHIDGAREITDIREPLVRDCSVELVTQDTDDGLHVVRHSASHIMADAICRLWPEARLSIGPSTEDGFYYDIDLPHKLTDDDLRRIEEKMGEIIAEDLPFEKRHVERDATLARYRSEGEPYKVEIIEDLGPEADITVYRHGAFEDLCRGPHVPSTGYVRAWKILRVAGAYWRGDENRPMLQRVYGTAFNSKKELEEHLRLLEEAKKRDHRKLGRELDLFSFTPLAPASPLFHPKGAVIYRELQNYMRELYRKYRYEEVITPQIFDVELWKTSGHYEKFKDNMYFTVVDDRECGVKPMNCPSHTLIYKTATRSYRDLPIRMADFGRLHRYERSGATVGLTRVRTFCQDDAHIFCREDQIGDEMTSLVAMIREVYATFSFDDVEVFLSTRPEKRLGSDETWDRAEAGLREALERNGLEYTVNPGDGAFYGPKIDFCVRDALRHQYQLSTIQLDFTLPERFDLEYDDPEGGKSRPVMVHRAVLGSIERFMGIIIEHYGGAFPLWLAPVQVRVATIADAHVDWAEQAALALEGAGVRVERDFDNAKIGAKIRAAELMKVPYVAVVGGREVETRRVKVRERGGNDLGAMSVEEFAETLCERIEAKK